MLRADAWKFSSSATSTTSVRPAAPSRFNSSAAAFVFLSDAFNSSTTMMAPSLSLTISAAFSAPRSTFFGNW